MLLNEEFNLKNEILQIYKTNCIIETFRNERKLDKGHLRICWKRTAFLSRKKLEQEFFFQKIVGKFLFYNRLCAANVIKVNLYIYYRKVKYYSFKVSSSDFIIKRAKQGFVAINNFLKKSF